MVPPWLDLSVGDRIVVPACHYVPGSAQARVIAAPPSGPGFIGKRVHWGPRVYEPDTNICRTFVSLTTQQTTLYQKIFN